MISFRYHIVSIVSVFLALAVGVALGGGPLKGEVDDSMLEQLESERADKAELRTQVNALGAGNQFTDDFAAKVAPQLLNGALGGRPVTLVALPGARDASITSATQLVGASGGSVGATIKVGKALLDVGNKQLVDELGSQLLAGTPDVKVAADAGVYERLGALLARATATSEDAGVAPDEAGNSVLSGLSAAKLASASGELTRRGSLVLVIGGSESTTSAEREGASAVVTSLVQAMDGGTDGVVVAGSPSSANDQGIIDMVRSEVGTAQTVSTVDTADRTAGRVVAVLALAEQARGGVGHYGAVDAAGGVMPAAPAP